MSGKDAGKLLRRLRALGRPEGQPGRWPWDEKPDKPGRAWDEKPQKPGSWDEVPEDRRRGH
jgi:hypothetical protein